MNLSRVAGWSAVAVVVLGCGMVALYMLGNASVSLYDGPALVREASRLHNVIFTRVVVDLGWCAALMVFAAALSQLIRTARASYAWVGTLVVGSAAVWAEVTLAGSGLEAGTALDTLSGHGDPSAVRALTDGYLPIYSGSIAFALTALFLTAVGYASVGTRLLPRWTGWFAYTSAALCVMSIPAMYGGAPNPHAFYNIEGWGPVIVAGFIIPVWFLAAAIYLLRAARRAAPHLTEPRRSPITG